MRYSHIKRFLSAGLLLAFSVPSSLTALAIDGLSNGSSMVLSANVKLTDKNDKITLSLRDSDVKQVLRMFADKAGYNIVFHNSVTGKVTLDLVNTPINDAFALVLKISGLNYYTQNNTMIIVSKNDPDNAIFSKQEMMSFPVKYVSAAKIADFLNKNVFSMKQAGLSSLDAATVNSARNEVIIFGMQSDAAIVKKVIDEFDREPLSSTFAVNHTTPAEMADMICNMLLPSRGASDSSSGKSQEGFAPPSPGVGTTGYASGIITGAAADVGGAEALTLGEGVVACTVSTASSGITLSAFDLQNLSVAYYPQRGTINVIGGSVSQQRMIADFIKNNDVKQPQALLEVSIIELNEDGSKEFSNQWAVQSPSWGVSFAGSSTTGGRVGSPGTKDFITLQRVSEDGKSLETTYLPREQWFKAGSYISWYMNYVIQNKKGRVLANPKILITNGQESVIDLTQDYVEKVTSEFLSSTGSGSGSTTGVVQKTYTIGNDLGLKVSLTPFISPEGYITMNIKPNYSTVSGQIFEQGQTKQSELAATLLGRRNLDLKNVRIKDNETLVIGGMIQENDTKTVSKIPILGDLPIVGPAFRSSNTTKTKTELVIMITPKILNDGEGSVADSL